MPRKGSQQPLAFKAHDVRRAVQAVAASGQQIERVSIDPRSGKIDVIVKPAEPQIEGSI